MMTSASGAPLVRTRVLAVVLIVVVALGVAATIVLVSTSPS
jgi:hypothetical protein